jgi:hypothetical protein
LLAAMLSPAPRVVLCGGEERGTWLREVGAASEVTFAYALALARGADGDGDAGVQGSAGALGRVTLTPDDGPAAGLAPAEWFALLHERKNFDGVAAPGWRLRLTWADA